MKIQQILKYVLMVILVLMLVILVVLYIGLHQQEVMSVVLSMVKKMRISNVGTITINNYSYIGQNDTYPDLRMGSANGNNLGIATTIMLILKID
jgi:hypothetical protein